MEPSLKGHSPTGFAGMCLDSYRNRLIGMCDVVGMYHEAGTIYASSFTKLYVANGGDGAYVMLDGRLLRRIASIIFGGDADNIRYDALRKLIYVRYGTGGLAIIDPTKDAKIKSSWTASGAEDNNPTALDEQYHRLFLGCRNPARLLMINTETGKQITALAIQHDPDDIFCHSVKAEYA